MTMEDLLAQIEALRAEYAERAKPARSGFIDPTEADLAKEDGERQAFEEVAEDLKRLLAAR